jgi:hypothetical protein
MSQTDRVKSQVEDIAEEGFKPKVAGISVSGADLDAFCIRRLSEQVLFSRRCALMHSEERETANWKH